jgi:transcriptional regulator with XRE-family HTH domain
MKDLTLFLYCFCMAAPHLKIDPNDCSEIGLLVLEYINEYKLTFTEMAERVDISRAALRIACLKEGNPGKKTIPKLASVLNRKESELCRMICENKIRQMYEDDEDDINSTLEAIDSFVRIIQKRNEVLQKKQDLNEYDIYQYALKSVTRIP